MRGEVGVGLERDGERDISGCGLHQPAAIRYVVNNGSDTVSQYAIDASGVLSPLGAATVATGNSPQSITVDPSHKYVYVTNLTDNTISQYVIQSDGTWRRTRRQASRPGMVHGR